MGLFKKKEQKPYTVVRNAAENTAEVNLYGEVVKNRPTDWWTGEKRDGLYIVEKEFLEDIERLETYDAVTFRINSVGGDADAGIAIYNRIRDMDTRITTIVDGLAASAASIIYMAGDKREARTGSQIMIHETSVGIAGYYNAEELKKMQKMLDGYDNALASIYAERAGIDKSTVRRMLKATEWMSAEDAVEKGFADEVTGETAPEIEQIDDKGEYVVVNGIRHHVETSPVIMAPGWQGGGIPAKSMVSNGREPSGIDNNKKKEGKRAMTLEELKAGYPDLCKQIEDEATEAALRGKEEIEAEAMKSERERIKEIESIEAGISDKKMVEEAKFGEARTTAKDLALKAMQAAAKKDDLAGEAFMAATKKDYEESGVGAMEPVPTDGYSAPNGDESKKEIVNLLRAAFSDEENE